MSADVTRPATRPIRAAESPDREWRFCEAYAAELSGAEAALAAGLGHDRRGARSIGRPLGDARFMAGLERWTKRRLRPGKRGPKPVAGGGHRLRIRGALAGLSPPPAPEARATTNATAREAAAASAERRQVNVMFCDLMGSTAFSAKLDPVGCGARAKLSCLAVVIFLQRPHFFGPGRVAHYCNPDSAAGPFVAMRIGLSCRFN
jgi:hypothetical protein